MAWQKYVSNHVPHWLHVVPLGLRASIWEILRFVIAGAALGLLAAVLGLTWLRWRSDAQAHALRTVRVKGVKGDKR